jgi:hypothetical protein
VVLEPDDLDAIAERVFALIRDEVLHAPARLVDAAALADALGVDRTWVYAHADELHAVRLGGEHGRLRFDIDLVLRSLNSDATPAQRRRRAPRRKLTQAGGELLPIDP